MKKKIAIVIYCVIVFSGAVFIFCSGAIFQRGNPLPYMGKMLTLSDSYIDGYNTKIIISAPWINSIVTFDYNNNSNDLAKELVEIISPYNLIDKTCPPEKIYL